MNIREKFLSTLSKARRSAASAAAKASQPAEREREREDAARHRGIMRRQQAQSERDGERAWPPQQKGRGLAGQVPTLVIRTGQDRRSDR